MIDKIKRGNDGERLAAEFLVAKGFKIIERNYHVKKIEIDLIIQRDNWLIFVEVKARGSAAFGYPEEFVDYQKEKLILKGAEEYTYQTNWQGNVRYDIVSVLFTDEGHELLHLEDAFY
jgi:putative endonuclease